MTQDIEWRRLAARSATLNPDMTDAEADAYADWIETAPIEMLADLRYLPLMPGQKLDLVPLPEVKWRKFEG